MDTLLEVQNLSKKIGDFTLSDVSFSIAPGYITGLIGRNGAGKTTLINTLMNLYQKDSGSVTVCGYSMETAEKEAKNRIGFVLDTFLFEEQMSVAANGACFGRLYSAYNHTLFLKFCERFNLKPSLKAGKLSKGQKTRFQLAFALSHDAKLFIMDEPSSGLDPLMRKELLGCMQDIVEDGTRSVLFSTHLTDDLDQIGDYILFIDDGRLLLNMDKETLKSRFQILRGTSEELDQIKKEHLVCRIDELFCSSALVKDVPPKTYKNAEAAPPSLEELMYYMQKGGFLS